jgi:hypothetical protein
MTGPSTGRYRLRQSYRFKSEGGFWNSCVLDKENNSLEFPILQPASVDLLVGDMFFNSSQDDEDDDSTPVT